MKLNKYTIYGVSAGWVWPWNATGNVIEVGKNGVMSLDSHPDGFILVTAKRADQKVPIRVAVYPGGWALIAEDSLRCDVCREGFSSTQALSNHMKTHGKDAASRSSEGPAAA